MTDNVFTLHTGNRAPAGLADDLRGLADAVDRGEITSLEAAFVRSGEYSFLHGASIHDRILYAALMHDLAMRDMRGGDI